MFSCAKKAVLPSTYKNAQLVMGNGGGFTGAVNSIYFLDNGDIFRNGLNDTSFTKIGTLNKELINQLFSNYQKLGLEKLQLNEPGNRYYQITYKDASGEHKIQWGKNELQNRNPAIFFNVAMNMVKKLEEKKS